jgi:hypothetical protein
MHKRVVLTIHTLIWLSACSPSLQPRRTNIETTRPSPQTSDTSVDPKNSKESKSDDSKEFPEAVDKADETQPPNDSIEEKAGGKTTETPASETYSDSSNGTLGPADSSQKAILSFIQKGSWKNWTAESPIRVAISAHGRKVQTFVNRLLLDSLRAKNKVHPKGSAAVKVLYDADGVTVKDYAFEQKIEVGESGNAWIWYEGFLETNSLAYYGKGLSTCTGCHSEMGTDFVTVKLQK